MMHAAAQFRELTSMWSESTSIRSLSPEFQLALLCCVQDDSPGHMISLQGLLTQIDVPAFLELVVHRHRIGPLAHGVLKRLADGPLPEELLWTLAQETRSNAIKVLQAQRAHRLLATWFAEAGMDWMPFKGITLAQSFYEEPTARHVHDLDVWVPSDALVRARAMLQSRGCRIVGGDLHAELADRGPQHAAYLERYYHEMQFVSPDVGTLELHWRLADNPNLFSLSPEAVRARAKTLQVAGVQVAVMNELDLLLYLCDHGARHGWGRLKWLADLPRLLASQSWNWAEVFDRADQARSRHSLLLGLGLCVRYLGWAAPEEVLSRLAAFKRLEPMMNLCLEFLSARSVEKTQRFVEVSAAVTRELRLSVMLNASPLSVAHQARRYLLSPKDLQALELPDRWFSAYYVLRPFLLIARRTGLL